jgi:hypothetical protein
MKYTVYQTWRGNPRETHPYVIVEAESTADAEAAIVDDRGDPPRGDELLVERREGGVEVRQHPTSHSGREEPIDDPTDTHDH